MDNVLIRKLKTEDADDISRIYAAITQTSVNNDFKRNIEEQSLRNEEANFVAELEGRLIGYMISHIVPGGFFGINKSVWISLIGVNPKYMGQGIGERLAEEVFKFARKKGVKDVYTSVRWDSTDLLSFFKTLGFDRSNFINLLKRLE